MDEDSKRICARRPVAASDDPYGCQTPDRFALAHSAWPTMCQRHVPLYSSNQCAESQQRYSETSCVVFRRLFMPARTCDSRRTASGAVSYAVRFASVRGIVHSNIIVSHQSRLKPSSVRCKCSNPRDVCEWTWRNKSYITIPNAPDGHASRSYHADLITDAKTLERKRTTGARGASPAFAHW